MLIVIRASSCILCVLTPLQYETTRCDIASKHQPSGDDMAIQYLLVTFPQSRAVNADGAAVGITNHVLILPADEYTITLDGGGYTPASQDIVLSGTSIVKPMVVAFQATSSTSTNTSSPSKPPSST